MDIVIGESEVKYAQKLAEYIGARDKDLNVAWYVDKESLRGHVCGKDTIIYLLGSDFWDAENLDELKQSGSHCLIILFSEGMEDKRLVDYPVIQMYQAADTILKQIYTIVGECLEDNSLWIGNPRKMIGVCAPWNLELSMHFAATACQILAREQKVLYITLQECFGRPRSFEDRNLSDIILRLRKDVKNPGALLKSAITTIGSVDYLPAVDNPQNLYDMSGTDYKNLIELVLGRMDYDMILLECPMMGEGLELYLKQCQIIYSPYYEEALMQESRNQIEHILSMHACEEHMDKFHFIKLPLPTISTGMGDIYEHLLWSEFGEIVREQVIGKLEG